MPQAARAIRRQKSKPLLPCSPFSFLSHLVVGILSFQVGALFGCGRCEMGKTAQDLSLAPPVTAETTATQSVFPESTIGKLITGAARIDRNDFTSTFDLGIPWDENKPGNTEVLMLYSHKSSLPPNASADRVELPVYSAVAATENCHSLQVVLVQPDKKKQCVAVVGQWQSYHVHNLMRLPKEGVPVDPKKSGVHSEYDLRYVSRHHQESGRVPGIPSASALTESYGKALTDYIQMLPTTLERLKPIAEKVAGRENMIVVLVCNFGQSELLFNFVCSAKARGLDLSKVLLFATDKDIIDLAQSLGIAVFDVEDAFGEMPTAAARAYGDRTFAGMMMAKVYCVHLINMLGFDVLFQDVDVVWYKNPLEFFQNKKLAGDHDMYFQDDGARSSRYAPYSPNTGFYFVRHNGRTEYLFSVFARMGDLIQKSGSHQSALTSLMSEHASWRGLRVKVFGRDDQLGLEFPGGFHYHKRKDFMKDIISGKRSPYVFHMSWTKNKDNKVKFFQQMGDWYLKQECVNKKLTEMEVAEQGLVEQCCTAEPQFQCHYRDKPSKTECKSSPPIDKGRPSFW